MWGPRQTLPIPPLAPAEACTELFSQGAGLQVTGPANRFRGWVEGSPVSHHKHTPPLADEISLAEPQVCREMHPAPPFQLCTLFLLP